MAQQKYTEEQKAAVLARVPEIGVRAAAEEAGIPWQAVSKWNKAAKTEESAFEVSEEAYAEMIEGEAKEVDIIDVEREKNAEALKEDIDATRIEAKKKTRNAGRKVKEKTKDVKANVEAKAEDVVVAAEIETKKKTAKASRKAKETIKTVKEKVEKSAKKVKAAKVDMIFETNGGRQIKPEEIAERVPKGVDAAYVKLEENKIYWVKGTETGSVDIW